MDNETQNKQPGQTGSLLALLIIIILMIVGGLYFWGQRLNQNDYLEINKTASGTPETLSATST